MFMYESRHYLYTVTMEKRVERLQRLHSVHYMRKSSMVMYESKQHLSRVTNGMIWREVEAQFIDKTSPQST
ncbi:hypothetical protein J6590_074546 [Homalodisca vitripennis]|nr:hypothetical protein J6590_074546 [Homalodisca vitripennis]